MKCRLLSNSVMVGLTTSIIILLGSILLWTALHIFLSLTPLEEEALRIPLAILACASAITYQRGVLGFLTALQDAVFLGAIKDIQILLNVILAWVLLVRGWSFFALSLSLAIPSVLVSVSYAIRVIFIAPGSLRNWPIPAIKFIRRLC